jgi:hypothetical protein
MPVKQLPSLANPIPRRPRHGRDVLVAVEDDLRGKRRVPRHLDRHMAPLRVHDMEQVVVDVRRLLRDVADQPAGFRAADPPHARRGLRGQHHEHPRAHLMDAQVLLGDQVLALPGLAADNRDTVHVPPGFQPAGEPAREPHQVRVVELLIAVIVEPAPPAPEPARIMAQGEVGIQHDPVHAVIAAGQQVPVPPGEIISHAPNVPGSPRPVSRTARRATPSGRSPGRSVTTLWVGDLWTFVSSFHAAWVSRARVR